MTSIAHHAAMLSSGSDANALPVTSGLILRLDASVISASDGSSLSSWLDTSGAGASTTVSPAMTYRLTGLNGHPGVELNPGSMTASPAWGSSGGTIFMAAKNKATGPSIGLQFNNTTAGTFTCWLTYVDGNIYDSNMATARTNALLSGGTNQTAPYLYTAATDAAGQKVRFRGVDVINSTTAKYATPVNPVNIGQRPGESTRMNAIVGEIIAYSRRLTDSEIAQVEAFLNTKWIV